MGKGAVLNPYADLENEALAIIARHRPELAGKTLEECRDILKAQYPGIRQEGEARPMANEPGAPPRARRKASRRLRNPPST